MRICHVTSAHQPFDGRIFERECTSLSKRYQVYLIVPNTSDCGRNGVIVKGVNIPQQRIKRFLHLKAIYMEMMVIDADVYHIHEPELIPYALKMKRKGKKVIFDSHENIPATILRMSYIPSFLRGIVSILYTIYEKSALKKFDAVVSVTPEIVNRLKKINPNTYMLTNYPIYTDSVDERKWERKIGFAGTVSYNWNIINVLKAIEKTNVTFELIGPSHSDYLDLLRSHPGWKNVNYHGQIKHQDVLRILKTCSVGLALESYDNPNAGGKKGSIGVTKIFEYMKEGIPVIATDLDNWVPIIEGTDSGYCIDPQNTKLLEEKIDYLLDNKEESVRMGDNGRRAVKEQYCWQTQEKTLFEMYEKVLTK